MEEKFSRKAFIRLGAALGVGAAGASVLAACGGESGSGGSGNGSGGGKASSQASSEKAKGEPEKTKGETGKAKGGAEKQAPPGQELAKTSAVAPGSAVKFKDSGQPAVLVHLQSGKFVAYSAVCTHQGCTVAYQNGLLACPCHGSVFDPASGGKVVNGPAQLPLPKIPVEVSGGEVFRVS